MAEPLSVGGVVGWLEEQFPPESAESWDAVGWVSGDPSRPARRILLAVDPTAEVAEEAVDFGADLLVVHHPLFLKPVHGFAQTTPKGRTVDTLQRAGCALYTAHTNADRASGGVSDALAHALGLSQVRPLVPAAPGSGAGMGRIGVVAECSLEEWVGRVARALPVTAGAIRYAGDPAAVVRTVAVTGGAGDFLLDAVVDSEADVYVTSDLRHHPALEFREKRGQALLDVPHWAAEWTWLPVLAAQLRSRLADTVVVQVSERVTDPWTGHAIQMEEDH
ncbi:MAG: Nif3-like dinuclear metal center hexameric protein [Nocardioides sp.]